MLDKVPLRDLFQVRSSKRVLKSQWQSSGVPFYRGREITLLSKQGYVDNELFITEESYNEFADKYGVPQPEDIVITAIGTIGNSYIVRENDRFYFKDASVLWLKKMSEVDSSYINLWLKSSQMREQLDEGNGATVDTLTIKKLQSLVVDLPPVSEQKRIVAILDQAFANIVKARTTAERNLKNARELFDSYLQQVFSQEGEGWVESSLEDIVSSDCSLSYGIVQPGNEFINGLPVVRPTDLTSKIIKPDGLKLIDAKLAKSYQRTSLQGGELLLCVRGSTGTVSQASNELKGANVTRGIVPVRFENKKITQKFGYYQFISKNVQKQIREKTYGAALMQINIRDVKKLRFSIPSKKRQQEAILNLDAITDLIESLDQVYLKKLKNLDELKESILQKAFTGELTKSKGIAA